MQKKSGVFLFCLMAVLLCFAGVCRAYAKNGFPGPIGIVSDFLFRPAQSLLSSWKDQAKEWINNVSQAEENRLEKERLEKELSQYRSDMRRKTALEQENQRLKKLLNIYNAQKEYTPVACRVIAEQNGCITGAFKIDKGVKEGVCIEDAVICTDGLVGRVSSVYEQSAIVTPFTEPGNSVAVRIVRNQALGVAESSGEEIKYTGFSEDLLPLSGDVAETSGRGGVYPAGILVGTVSERSKQNVVLQPSVNLRELHEVLVLVNVR